MVLLAAAIEIGTTFSRYAFSLKHELATDPSKIHIKKWGSREGVREKIPTSLLLTPQRKFAGFGYDAEHKYVSHADESQLGGWYFFQHFGHILYDSCGPTKRTMLKDVDGRKLSAIIIISKFIKCLKNDLLEEVRRSLGDLIPASFIFWVLTVPASCGDEARQFIREATINAGIDEKQLLIVPKPVAVLKFCKCLLDSVDRAENKGSEDGRKCLILDAGGERTDATLLEMLMDDSVRVLNNESITEGRSSLVDEAFLNFIVDIVGHNVMNRFSKEYPEDHQDLLRKIQRIKNSFMGEESGNITIKFPLSMQELVEKESGKSFRDAVKQSMYHNKISCLFDKLRINNDLMKHLFDPPISAIVNYLAVLFQNPKIKGTDTILLAGGFSGSPMLQMAVRNAFTAKKVIITKNQGEVALKGAVLHGLEADIVHQNNAIFSPCEFDTPFYRADGNIASNSHMEHDNVFSDNAQGEETQIVSQEKIEEYKISEDCHQAQTVGKITTGQNHYSLDPFSLEDRHGSLEEMKTTLEDVKQDVRSIKETVEKLVQSKSSGIEEISIKWHADGVNNLKTFEGGNVRPKVRKESNGEVEADTGPLATRYGCSYETGAFTIYFHTLIDIVSANIFRRFFRTLVYISAEEKDQDTPDVDMWIDKKEHDYRQSCEAYYQLLREWLRWFGQLDIKTYMNLITKTMQECGLNEENAKYMERIKSRLKKKH